MSKGTAQWRNRKKQLADEVDLLRHIQRIYGQKDELYNELQQSKRVLVETKARHMSEVNLVYKAYGEMTIQNAELRRPHSSGSKGISEYEREGMVRLMTAGAVERGQLETEVEFYKAKVGQLEAEVEFQRAKVCELEKETELGGGMPWGMKEWRKTYKALALLLHPDRNANAGEDDPRTKAFKALNELNEFCTQ
jgi:hypothetical protein